MFKHILALAPALFLLYLIRFDLFGMPTNVIECFTGILFVWWLFQIIPKKKEILICLKTHKRVVLAALLFIIATTIALIITLTRLETEFMRVPLGIWKGWVIAPFLLFIMLLTTFRTKDDLEKLIKIFIYSASIYAILAIFEYFMDFLPGPAQTYDGRLAWPFYDPETFEGASGNYPALFLGPAIMLAFEWLLKKFRTIKQLLTNEALTVAFSIFFMGFAVFLTQSFAAWLAIIISASISVFLRIRTQKKWLMPIIACLVIFIIALSQINSEKFRYALQTDGDSSTAERIRIYTVSLEMIKKDPLFGTGIGQYQTQFEKQAPEIFNREISRKEINHALHTHNLFLMMYLSFGILGLLAFIYLLYVLFTKNTFAWVLMLGIPLLALIIHGLFDVPYFKNDLAFEFWFLASLIAISKHLPETIKVTVIKGMGLAGKWGFPTVNLKITEDTTPLLPYGVYTASLSSSDNTFHGILGFGKRFTQNINEETCEIHLFDATGFTASKGTLSVGTKIRGWRRFKNIDKLKKAIRKDITRAKKLAGKA